MVLSSDTEGSKYGVMWVILGEYRDELDAYPYNNQMLSSTRRRQPSGPGALRIKGDMANLASDLRAISQP